MEYRNYGSTGKKVSFLGFGGMRFENPGDLEGSAETVLHASDKGITYFDTAPLYCEDQSEIIMGMAIKEMKKQGREFYISSKSSKHSGVDLRENLETSLKRLNVDSLDFYHCWYVLSKEDWGKRKSGGAVAELLKAKEEGLVKHVVISTHMMGSDIRDVLHEGYFEGVTLGYSAVNFPFRQEGIAAAAARNMGVVVMNPLGGGAIIPNEEAFGFIKVKPDQTMLDGALHFLMANKDITTAIVGFRNKHDIDTAVESIERYVPYTKDDLKTIEEKINTDFNSLCTSCAYCKNCPEGIDVWKFVESANGFYIKSSESISDRLRWHWGAFIDELDKCTKCRKCERACTQHLPILERFEMLKKEIPGIEVL